VFCLETHLRRVSAYLPALDLFGVANVAVFIQGEMVMAPEDEERQGGSVAWSVYGKYLSAMANPFCCLFWLFGYFAFVQAVYNLSDWWLNLWYVP
jgi:hypothetical protein